MFLKYLLHDRCRAKFKFKKRTGILYASLSELILFIGNARYCNINPGYENEESKSTFPLLKVFPTTTVTITPSLCVRVCMLNRFSCVWVCVTLWIVACQALCPWDSPGKNTGVDCHALLQGLLSTQESNSRLLWLLCRRQILYHWATRKA